MSSKRFTVHRRRICAMGAGVFLMTGGWLPVATARPTHHSAPLSQMDARCDGLVTTGSLRQPDRLGCAGSEPDPRTGQQGG